MRGALYRAGHHAGRQTPHVGHPLLASSSAGSRPSPSVSRRSELSHITWNRSVVRPNPSFHPRSCRAVRLGSVPFPRRFEGPYLVSFRPTAWKVLLHGRLLFHLGFGKDLVHNVPLSLRIPWCARCHRARTCERWNAHLPAATPLDRYLSRNLDDHIDISIEIPASLSPISLEELT